jgi:hypothetical protein
MAGRPHVHGPARPRISPRIEVDEAIQAAVVPTPADVMAARSIALELAEHDPTAPLTNDVLDAWLQRPHELRLATAPTQVSIESEDLRWIPPARDAPALVKIRGTAAVSTALAQLIADGLLTKVHGDLYREEVERHLSVSHSGGSNNVSYRLNYPDVDPSARWRPVARYGDTVEAPAEVLDAAGTVEGLDDLLGPRGIRSLTEAHVAYRRRLWLGAAALLATASEAAWFSLGRRIATPNSRLAALAAEGDNAAKVHDLATQYNLLR